MSIDDFKKNCANQNIKDGDPVAIYYQDFEPIQGRIVLPPVNENGQWYLRYQINKFEKVLLTDVKAVKNYNH